MVGVSAESSFALMLTVGAFLGPTTFNTFFDSLYTLSLTVMSGGVPQRHGTLKLEEIRREEVLGRDWLSQPVEAEESCDRLCASQRPGARAGVERAKSPRSAMVFCSLPWVGRAGGQPSLAWSASSDAEAFWNVVTSTQRQGSPSYLGTLGPGQLTHRQPLQHQRFSLATLY